MQFASQRMEIKIRKLGIIAGDGDLPIQIINECKKQKKDFVVILINGHGTEISKSYNPDYIMNLSKIGKAIKFAKTNNIIDLVMAGRIKRPSLKDMFEKGERYELDWWNDESDDADPKNPYYAEGHSIICGHIIKG